MLFYPNEDIGVLKAQSVTVYFGFLFHANMPYSFAFEPAYYSSYLPLTELTTEYDDFTFNWHWSAPLLNMIQWRYPELISKIRHGLENQRFEVITSGFAQNVLMATSWWANREHLIFNNETIEDILHYKPRGYWNSERVWTDKIGELLVEEGIGYTLVEERILNKIDGVDGFQTYNLHGLDIVPDTQDVMDRVDATLWSGETTELFKLIDTLPQDKDIVITYAQDAEASGYWQVSQGVDPRETHRNLRKIFDELKERSWIEVTTFSDILSKTKQQTLKTIPDGQASWMVVSAQYDDYTDYFHYLRDAPELKYYNKVFGPREKILKQYLTDYPDNKLVQEARKIFLTHQFEFGCTPGAQGNDQTRYLMNVPGKMYLEGVRLLDRIFRAIDGKTSFQWIEEHGDRYIEWQNEHIYSMWTPLGGRCILLIDKENQAIVSPNLHFYNGNRYLNEVDTPMPKIILPDLGSEMIHSGSLFEDNLKMDGKSIGSSGIVERSFSKAGYNEIYDNRLSFRRYDSQILNFDNKIKFWTRDKFGTMIKEVQLKDRSFEVMYKITDPKTDLEGLGLDLTFEFANGNAELVKNRDYLSIEQETPDNSFLIFTSDSSSRVIPEKSFSNHQIQDSTFAKRLNLQFPSFKDTISVQLKL